MSGTSGNQTRATSTQANERATGRSWGEWIEHFESHGAQKLGHPEIAKLALSAMPATLENPEWWAQGTAIAFEQHAGLRVPGQSSTGDFRVSVSRTLPVDRDAALEAWSERFGNTESHQDHAVENVRESRTEKRSFIRFSLVGAGKVEVAASPKDAAKTSLAINHTGLESAGLVEDWRAYWKALLTEL
ncbi:hypothetical protein [Leucobacter denitrificans]|uniref:DUF4287 domain-containing protein n=1 Tax=Leucobacter denitrificans TaxID=683042 RepID=A0A7G9S1Y6_9MICO|nr:hypothetical protein [Leucobacter denitrificans]QNN61861.1 hypothetical protein H9L06_05830 [Leucobacter denitrificans]